MTAQPVEAAHDAPLASPAAGAAGVTRSGAVRIDGIDALRGLVIVLMVLDHVRDFFHATAFTADPMALDSGNPALFLTRWVTHLCAPTFVFLAGLSVWLQKANGKSPGDLSRFLLTRGLWLLVLEFTLIGVGFNFGWWIFAQVIWAIGFGMIVLAALHRLPRNLVLALGVIIIAGHPALNLIAPSAFGPLEPLWRALAVRGPFPTDAGLLLVVYPAIQWTGILLLGYGLAGFLTDSGGLRRGRVMLFAAGFLTLFAVGRGFNLPGFDTVPWTMQESPLWSVFSIISANKYPPSPAYVLLTLGLAFVLLLVLDRLRGPVTGVFLTFGRTPLFTYLLHIWVAHALAVAVGMALGVPPSAFIDTITDPSRLIELGWGFSLPWVYVAWAAVLILLYPLSRWFEGVKRRRRDWWLGYL
ncbi:DUF1624 domain-containing protein [Brevundimonas sp.]|uniref:DUF1624 domain-containing protein n=1 Tax=Brevundimonas sp. TaxID=1871086 RepID=UPI002D2CE43C|nr:heparan-alpha-glucosaminide N-acetyltransferase domain-containing protein [Brevundimonas sp.]HYC96579.1 heparan-alpha-glucosaminide N-acetyltransferase domain-containing protein [Brevundimonas sp.]